MSHAKIGVFDLTYFSRSQRSKLIWFRLPIIPNFKSNYVS
jgi:hypothetical protein